MFSNTLKTPVLLGPNREETVMEQKKRQGWKRLGEPVVGKTAKEDTVRGQFWS